jgi:hypothetical protein
MNLEDALRDVETREQQLRLHLLRSEEYVRKFEREFKRQVFMLYISIMLLLGFQSLYGVWMYHRISYSETLMIVVTTFLAIFNCLLLIRTKSWLRRLNEAWLDPSEKRALDSVRMQRRELLERLASPPAQG